ncbi:T3SS effector HopA1 family protein [Sorangium sp. So ce1389]|uniref:T3SS effector HopA1 family protein n=1 Tax=Sorangium sp. So ce1389 TaxID=3133336 RepID=UPI003F6175A1
MSTEHRCHPDFEAVVRGVSIISPTEYTLFGERRDLNGAELLKLPSPGASSAPPLVTVLGHDLYLRFYVRPVEGGAALGGALEHRDHVSALSAANTGSGTWEAGWKILSVDDDGRVAVTRDQVTFWVARSGLRTTAGALRTGEFCRVKVGKEMRQLIPGFYCAIGDGESGDGPDTTDGLVRFYWSLQVEAAARYMAVATRSLNGARIPFRTKVIADPGGYVRADAGVLYLERRHYAAARAVVAAIYEQVKDGLRPEVPRFTKKLADGLALAEDPADGMSFGQSRCKVVAEALWASFDGGASDPDVQIERLVAEVRQRGLDPMRPYLNQGSSDVYARRDLGGQAVAPGRRKIERSRRRGRVCA